MKKAIFILFISFSACKAGSDFPSKNCVEKQEREILLDAVKMFDTKVQQRYPELSIESGYFEFISDLANKKIPIEFFQDSLEIEVKNLNIWYKSERTEDHMELEKEIYNVPSMNPIRTTLSSEFSTCLAHETDIRGGISSFLRANSKIRLSPKVAAQKYLFKTSPSELKIFENRLAIVLGVYYQTMFNIKKSF